jgi:hypothetical protein
MAEPADHTGWVDKHGDIWVRSDNDMPGRRGDWWQDLRLIVADSGM